MENYNKKAIELADFIESNPNCKFEIDNDCWYITKLDEDSKGDDSDQLATSRDFDFNTNWYSYGNQYGSALSEAMVILLNRKGFKIESSAV